MATPAVLLDTHADHLDLATILGQVVGGKASSQAFFPEADPYAMPPDDLVRSLGHDPEAGSDDKKPKEYIFFATVQSMKSAAASEGIKRSPRRYRAVKGGGGGTCWHQETGKMQINDKTGTLLAYSSRLTYMWKRRAVREGRGWIMIEIMHPDLIGHDEMLILCKLHKGRPKDKGASVSAPVPRPAPVPLSRDTSPLECKPEELSIVEVKPDLLDSKPQSSKGEGILGRSGWFITKTKQPPSPAVVMMLGAVGDSSSMYSSAEQIDEMARKVIKFSAVGVSTGPVVVVSALQNTTTNLLNMAALKAFRDDGSESKINELREVIEKLHLGIVEDLELDISILSDLLDDLDRELHAVPTGGKLNDKTRAYLASFGERICATIFAAYLNHLGEEAGEWKLQTVNICGSGGTDLTATTVAKELGSTEIQVWNGARGGMTCDPPTIYGRAIPQPYLTFEEAEEIMFFDRQSMLLAREGCISIKVKNLYKPEAPGTVITKTREMSKSMLTSIVLKSNIIMLDIKSKIVPAQSNFVARCYSTFESESIIVECVASSADRMSVIVASSKQSARELVNMEVGTLVEKLGNFADVNPLERSIISLVGNAQESPRILQKTFQTLAVWGVKVQMMGQQSAKEDEQVTIVTFLVKESEAKSSVQALHSKFFLFERPDRVNSSSAAASSSEGIERYSLKSIVRSGIGGPNPFSVKKPEQTTEPVRSAQDDGRKSDGVMDDIGAAEAQPEVPVDVTAHIGNSVHDMSSRVLSEASSAPETIDGKVEMLWQLPAKEDEQVTATSFVVKESESERSVFNNPPVVNPSLEASSTGEKRKVDDEHPEAPPSARQMQMMGTAPSSALVETEVTTFFVKPRDLITEPIRSDMEDLGSLEYIMDAQAREAQPGQLTGFPVDSSFTGLLTGGPPIDSRFNGQHTLAPYPPSAAGDTNAQKFPGILAKGHASSAQETIDGNIQEDIQMLEQLLAAKEDEQVKAVSFYVKDSKAECSIRAVQSESFELNSGNSFVAASSSGQKRKMDEDHPEAPPSMRQLQMAGIDPSVVQERTDGSDLEETERTAFSGMDADQAMLYNIPDKNTFEPDVSAMEFDELLNSLNESPPVAQPEHTFGSGMDFSSGDFGTHPDVGEGCSGTPNVLDDTEHSCHSVKKADHNSLKNIEYRKLDDNPFSMPANCQRYGGGYPLQPNPLGMGHHTSAPYPLPATGYHTSAGVDNSPGTGGDDSGGYPPPGGDYSPLFNEDECKNLDGENNYICNKEDWPIL